MNKKLLKCCAGIFLEVGKTWKCSHIFYWPQFALKKAVFYKVNDNVVRRGHLFQRNKFRDIYIYIYIYIDGVETPYIYVVHTTNSLITSKTSDVENLIAWAAHSVRGPFRYEHKHFIFTFLVETK